MSLHADLLGRLQAIARVQLVARLQDDRLSFPGANELHVFIPDIPLITAARRVEGGYQYGTNHPVLLQAVEIAARADTRFRPGQPRSGGVADRRPVRSVAAGGRAGPERQRGIGDPERSGEPVGGAARSGPQRAVPVSYTHLRA